MMAESVLEVNGLGGEESKVKCGDAREVVGAAEEVDIDEDGDNKVSSKFSSYK